MPPNDDTSPDTSNQAPASSDTGQQLLPNGSDAEERSADSSNIKQRLERQKRQLEKKHLADKDKWVLEGETRLRAKVGLTQQMEQELAGRQFSDVYKRVAELESTVAGYEAEKQAARDERKAQLLTRMLDKYGVHETGDAREMALSALASKLDLSDDGLLVAGSDTPENVVKAFLDANTYLMGPVGNSGADSHVAAPGRQQTKPPDERKGVEVAGIFFEEATDEQKRAAIRNYKKQIRGFREVGEE